MTIKELVTKYNLTQNDCWELSRGGKKIWIITHNACEKIAALEKIEIEKIDVLNSEYNFVRFLIHAKLNDRKILTIGEALLNEGKLFKKGDKNIFIGNCESQYIGCMAEKRGIDRAVLKLVNAYEYDIYSETESDEFKRGKQ